MKNYAPHPPSFRSIFALFLLGLALVLGLTACQQVYEGPQADGVIRVKIPLFKEGRYQIQVVELRTLSEIIQLRGEAAQFLFSPSNSAGQLTGFEPRIRVMRNRDGVYIAEDSLSLQMLSLYFHFESLMDFDQSLGLKSLNKWPRTVAVQTRILEKNGDLSSNNARYTSKYDAFLFEPYSKQELPLGVNAGVIGHEHFHSLFYQLVLRKLAQDLGPTNLADPHAVQDQANEGDNQKLKARAIYHLSLLRGINEGMADVWGWIYSGDTNFVSRSLKGEESRNLKGGSDSDSLPGSEKLKGDFNPHFPENERLANSYKLGTRYARLIYSLVQDRLKRGDKKLSEIELRNQLARAISEALPELARALQNVSGEQVLQPSQWIAILSQKISFLDKESCELIKSKVADESKSKICANQRGVNL